jgi:VWFA-related protein
VRIAVSVFAFPALFLSLGLAQQKGYRFETRVEAVAVDVSVTRDNQPVGGLTAENFEIKDNGVLQEVDLVQVETAPVEAFLILDNSGSVAGTKLERLRVAVRTFLSGLGDQDRAALMTFFHHLRLNQELTSDLPMLYQALDETTPKGGTALYDALFAGLKLAEPPVRRPVIVLFTDSEDTASRMGEKALLPMVKESNAVIYVIGVTTSMSEELFPAPVTEKHPRDIASRVHHYPRAVQPTNPLRENLHQGPGSKSRPGIGNVWVERQRKNQFMREVAETAGGRFWYVDDEEKLEAQFVRALEEIKSRYLVSYTPRGVDEPGWHSIEVKLKHRKGDVRARRGYFSSHRSSDIGHHP